MVARSALADDVAAPQAEQKRPAFVISVPHDEHLAIIFSG
jgi:hypothetical protein